MPFLLRKIRKVRWLVEADLDWLKEGELPSDPLGDLSTKDNTLSVWHVDTNKSNLDRLLAALASGPDKLSHLDYALFDEALLSKIGIEFRHSPGASADAAANTNWHRDLVELSASKLVELAVGIRAEAQINRLSAMEAKQLVIQGVRSNHLDSTKLRPKLLSEASGDA